MRCTATLFFIAATGSLSSAFTTSFPLRCSTNRASRGIMKMAYVPDGLSPDEWKKIQKKEKETAANLGRVGPIRFKSRSFKAWQESGASHLFPVDPKKVKSGEVPLDKVPYMQRGGAWDDSDLARKGVEGKTSKKIVTKQWSETDKKYANGGYKKDQSVSVFGGASLPWTAQNVVKGPSTTNNRKVKVQQGLARPGTGRAMSADVKRRIDKEVAQQRKKAPVDAQDKAGSKKGPFGLW